MPYKKYNNKRRYPSKQSKLNPRQKKEVKKMVKGQIELKSFDTGGFPSVATTGAVTRQTSIPQGVGNSQRIGDDVQLVKMDLSYEWAIADPFNTVRIIYFQWHMDDAFSIPGLNDILFTAPSNDPTNALYNFSNRDKYKILYDKRHFLEAGSEGSESFSKKLSIKIPHKTLSYNSGGVLTGTNNIYQLLVTDSNTVLHPSCMNHIRFYYRDA